MQGPACYCRDCVFYRARSITSLLSAPARLLRSRVGRARGYCSLSLLLRAPGRMKRGLDDPVLAIGDNSLFAAIMTAIEPHVQRSVLQVVNANHRRLLCLYHSTLRSELSGWPSWRFALEATIGIETELRSRWFPCSGKKHCASLPCTKTLSSVQMPNGSSSRTKMGVSSKASRSPCYRKSIRSSESMPGDARTTCATGLSWRRALKAGSGATTLSP